MEPTNTPPQTSQPSHPHHHAIFGLLIAAIVLMLGLFALMGYQLFFAPQPEPTSVVETPTTPPAPTPEPEPTDEEPVLDTQLFSAAQNEPSFFYPLGWHVFSSNLLGSEQPELLNTIIIDPNPIRFVLGDPVFAVTMNTIDPTKADLGEFSRVTDVQKYQNSDASFYQDVTINERAHFDGTLTRITGRSVGGFFVDHSFEVIVYETATKAVVVTYRHFGGPDEQEGWEAIRDSLEFSVIK